MSHGARRVLIAAIAMVACTRPTPFTVREDLRYLVVGPAEVPDPVILALELDASPVVFAPSSSTFWALGYPRFDRGAAWLPVTTRAQPLMGAQLPVLPFPAPAEALRVFDGEVSGGIDVGAVPLAPDTPCVLVPSGPRRGLGARAEIQGSARTSSRSVTLLTRDGAIAAVGPAAFGSAADGLVPLPWGALGEPQARGRSRSRGTRTRKSFTSSRRGRRTSPGSCSAARAPSTRATGAGRPSTSPRSRGETVRPRGGTCGLACGATRAGGASS